MHRTSSMAQQHPEADTDFDIEINNSSRPIRMGRLEFYPVLLIIKFLEQFLCPSKDLAFNWLAWLALAKPKQRHNI